MAAACRVAAVFEVPCKGLDQLKLLVQSGDEAESMTPGTNRAND